MLKKSLFLFLLLNSTLAFSSPSFLVDINWLAKNLNSSSIRLIDMSGDTQFQRFHIPGATHLPYAAINMHNKKGVSLSVGKDNIIKILGLLGIQTKHHVVIYDDMGGLHAGRLFWELEKIGHKNISILNGGLVKWILSGKKVTAKSQNIKAVQYKTDTKSGRNNTATLEEILNTTFNSKNILLDVRSKEEYSGHPRYPKTGHIPKAKWWEWSQSVNFENAFKMQKQTMLKKQLQQLGISKTNTPITLYCQSAHRAAQSYFTLRQLGFENVKVYDGSMSEYSKVKSAPLIKGLKP
ncbi:MAG: sulfurtransferase [Gammaproteobacteria bacterium]|nr:sulfurtransferase [Gammaproteobacteria bacterium]